MIVQIVISAVQDCQQENGFHPYQVQICQAQSVVWPLCEKYDSLTWHLSSHQLKKCLHVPSNSLLNAGLQETRYNNPRNPYQCLYSHEWKWDLNDHHCTPHKTIRAKASELISSVAPSNSASIAAPYVLDMGFLFFLQILCF